MGYESMTKAELAVLAARRGLSTSGTKADLVRRLVGDAPPVDVDLPVDDAPPVDTDEDQVSECETDLLPLPPDWPEDLPQPDREVPQPAPPLHPEMITLPGEGLFAVHGTGRRRECTVTYTVTGRGRVEGGRLLPAANVELREQALSRALAAGLNARAPRLRSWTATSALVGTAAYSMIIKGG